ncbi:hypothetical protein Zmor_012865 [Zophobas morio]|uniref:CHK kinase-like domain-containing protein n=1 Tax=Zophobas morio TaxID=2755281 RepID=A0AA38IC31_9CUCU|nr:hypothetical protein Zmor_012865 [Zophobas morio]
MESINLSPFDCRKIVSKTLKTDDFTILSAQKTSLDEIGGYLGDHSSLKITIKHLGKNQTLNYFAKCLPSNPSQRNLALEINAFVKEDFFYGKFCDELTKHSVDLVDKIVPSCFYSRPNIVILEDLTTKGYTTLPPRFPFDTNFVKAGLSTLAKLHASGFLLQDKKSSKLCDDFDEFNTFFSDKPSVKKAIQLTRRGIEALIDVYDETLTQTKDKFKTKVLDGFDSRTLFGKSSTKFKSTICHGDLWKNNFMFKVEDKIECVLVDFQSYRYAPPGQDVMTFLHFVTSEEVRTKHFDEFVEFYYDELVDNLGVGVLSKREFVESCRYFKEFALIQALGRCQMVGVPDQTKTVTFDDRYNFVKTMCQSDPVFRQINFEAVRELRRFYELNP